MHKLKLNPITGRLDLVEDLTSYKILSGSAVVIGALKQLFIVDEYIIEGTGVLTVNSSGLLAVY